MLTEIQKQLLKEIADLHKVPEGAYNIRANGEAAGRNSTANIEISSKTDKPGIDIRIKPGRHEKRERAHSRRSLRERFEGGRVQRLLHR